MCTNIMKIIAVLCVCGLAVGSEESKKSEHRCGVEASTNPIHHNPWTVFLEFYRHGQRHANRCGGSLITSRHVVTAAHCVRRGLTKHMMLVARLGEYDLSSALDCVNGACAPLPLKVRAQSVLKHPLYDGTGHDIAIITLAHDVPYTDAIRPICLPSGLLNHDVILNAAGWGEKTTSGFYSDVKKNIFLPYWSPEKCQNAYKHIPLPKHTICAGGERGVDTCRGDSGGPLVAWKGGHAQLWGVTSFGNAVCGTKGYPGIYTSVIDHLEWVKKNIQM